ncbi:serine hydrolase [Geomicrobium sp. JCM 19038]|uniref:serine hydrolase domain-containing protein n=1 Tax=Geomicrobium sp. JCM 19038 TaxID=1460635 RepID=UPI00045F48AD|nr:serine hydrolase domain-containing protein [Geomicrobium sp. JCM 19038]GAK08374.1 beta-lactamase [Geomicrobium sp. JCM 19038]
MNLSDEYIVERMKQYNIQGLSVTAIDGGNQRLSRQYGVVQAGSHRKIKTDTLFNACSVSKFVTALTVLKLVEQGLLHLDQPVNDKLIRWKIPSNNKKAVTLRHLLSHQAGIIDPKESFQTYESRFGVPTMPDILNGKTAYCSVPITVEVEPEHEFHYSDAGYCIIQLLIEDITRQTFERVVNNHVFTPLQLQARYVTPTSLAYISDDLARGHSKQGQATCFTETIYPYPAASGLWASSITLAKILQELLDARLGKSTIGLSKKLAKEMLAPQFGKAWSGFGVFIEDSKAGKEIVTWGWGKGYQCMGFLHPEFNRAAVIMTNGELGVHQMEGLIGEVYQCLTYEK